MEKEILDLFGEPIDMKHDIASEPGQDQDAGLTLNDDEQDYIDAAWEARDAEALKSADDENQETSDADDDDD